VLWFIFLLAYGDFPIGLSGDLHKLFIGVTGNSLTFWLVLIVVPITCILPTIFWKQVRR
jgi:phospholipid-transporting ATPase